MPHLTSPAPAGGSDAHAAPETPAHRRGSSRRRSGNPECLITKRFGLLEAAFDSRTIMRRGRSSSGAYGRLRGPERAPGQDLDSHRGRRGDRRPRADAHPGERSTGRPGAAPDGLAGHAGTTGRGTLPRGLPHPVPEVRAQACPPGERHAARDGGFRAADTLRSRTAEQGALRRSFHAEEPQAEHEAFRGPGAGCGDLRVRCVHARAVGSRGRADHGGGRRGDAYPGAGAQHRPDDFPAARADARGLPVTRR